MPAYARQGKQYDDTKGVKTASYGGRLVTVVAPYSGAKFYVDPVAASRFSALLNELESSGYRVKTDKVYNPTSKKMEPQYGSYVQRNMRNSNKPSQHGMGNAIDINTVENAYHKNGRPNGVKTGDMPEGIEGLAKALGIETGQTWGTPYDPEHFEGTRTTPAALASTPQIGANIYGAKSADAIDRARERLQSIMERGTIVSSLATNDLISKLPTEMQGKIDAYPGFEGYKPDSLLSPTTVAKPGTFDGAKLPNVPVAPHDLRLHNLEDGETKEKDLKPPAPVQPNLPFDTPRPPANVPPANAMDAASRPFVQPQRPISTTPPSAYPSAPAQAAAPRAPAGMTGFTEGYAQNGFAPVSSDFNRTLTPRDKFEPAQAVYGPETNVPSLTASMAPAATNAMDAASRPFNAAEMAAARASPAAASRPDFDGTFSAAAKATPSFSPISPGGTAMSGFGGRPAATPVAANKLSPSSGDKPGPVQTALSSAGKTAMDAASRAWSAVSSAASGLGALNHPTPAQSGAYTPSGMGGYTPGSTVASAGPPAASLAHPQPTNAGSIAARSAASVAAQNAANAAAAAQAASKAYEAAAKQNPGVAPGALGMNQTKKPGELGSSIQTQQQWADHVAALQATATAAAQTAAVAAQKATTAKKAIPAALPQAPVMDPNTSRKPAPEKLDPSMAGSPVFDDSGKQVGTIDSTGKAVGLSDTWGQTAKTSIMGGLFGGLPGAVVGALPSALNLNSAAGWGGPVGSINAPPTTTNDVIGPTGRPGYTGKVNNGVMDRANQLGLGAAPAGYHYGWSPIGNGVTSVYSGAPEGIQIAASGSGLLGALGLANNTGYTGYKGPTPSSLVQSGVKALGAALSPKMPARTEGTRGGVTNLGGVMQGYADSNARFNEVGNQILGALGLGGGSNGGAGGFGGGAKSSSAGGNLHG